MRILFVIFTFVSSSLIGQEHWVDLLNQSQDQWCLKSFYKHYPNQGAAVDCPPQLKEAIPATSDLDNALHPYELDPAVEAVCIDMLFANDCQALTELRMLSDLYFPLFERHLASKKLDEEFKFLPLVLSAMNSDYSDKHNKAGIWGLDYPRAIKNGLRIDDYIDERKAPDQATKAAVALLADYMVRFDGDHLKVIVAMMRGVNFAQQFDPATSIDDELSFELTMLHVCLRLFNNTEATNHLIGWLTFLNTYEAIGVKKTFDINALKLLKDVDLVAIRGINTAYESDSVIGMYRGVPFLLPADVKDEFYALEDSIYGYVTPKKEKPIVPKPVVPSGTPTYYTVRSGDVLGSIAEKYNVRVSQIRNWNGLRNDNIYVGQRLEIYAKGKTAPPPPPKKEEKKPVSPTGEYTTYTVKSGESLWLIAKKFPGVSAENIMEWNGIDNDIRPGQQLKIYTQK